jgi:hypothetical protein
VKRKLTILFGSFDRGRFVDFVFSSAEDWALLRVSDVLLEGNERVTHDLGTWMADSARLAGRPVPERVDAAWFREVAPMMGLEISPDAVKKTPFSLAFVAGKSLKAPDGSYEETAYPFLVRGSGDQVLVEFSAAGPELEIRRSIVTAFGERILVRL